MRNLLIVTFLLTVCNVFSQTTLNGKTEEYNGREAHTPLGQVELTVRDASSTVSDQKGNFKLKFLTLKPGDKVTVRNIDRDIKKEGYEVFNKDALDQWILSNSKTTFSIVLCKKESFKKLKDKWNSKSSASYKKQWEKSKANLKKQLDSGKLKLAQYQKKLLELEDQYYAQLDNLDNYIDRFARIDLSKMDANDSLIVEKIEDGQIDEVIKAYEQQKNLDRYLKAQEEIDKIQEGKRKLSKLEEAKTKEADTYYAKIKQEIDALYLAGGAENINKIDSILYNLASKDTLKMSSRWNYAVFLQGQHETTKAEYWYKKCFECNPNFGQRCSIMDNLSALYIEQGDYDKGYNILKSLLDSLDNYMIVDSIKLLPNYVIALGNIASCYLEKGEYVKAEKTYLKIDTLCSRFINRINLEKNGKFFRNKLAALYQLSILYLSQGLYSKGILLLSKAIPEARTYSNSHQELEDFSILAGLEGQLGVSYMYNNQLDSAEVYFKLAIELYEKLYLKDKKSVAPNLSSAYNNLCNNYYYKNNLPKAVEYAEKALSLNKRMIQNGNRNDKQLYCDNLNNTGYLCYFSKNYTEAEKYFTESKSISESLYSNYPDIYCRIYAYALINIFTVYLAENKLSDCDRIFDIMCKVTEETRKKMGAGFDSSYKIYNEQVTLYNQKRQGIAKE